MQRVNFTLFDLTTESDVVKPLSHLNAYYLNFYKSLIVKSTPHEFRNTEQFKALSKESPIVLICDTGSISLMRATELEVAGYLNIFYVHGGAPALLQP
jgi:hypothetical protein